jgi:hypothetical protein
MDAKTWRSTTTRPWRVYAYDAFKRAPDRSLDVDTQADKFAEFNDGKLRTDAEWWVLWERWCHQAVDYARRST